MATRNVKQLRKVADRGIRSGPKSLKGFAGRQFPRKSYGGAVFRTLPDSASIRGTPVSRASPFTRRHWPLGTFRQQTNAKTAGRRLQGSPGVLRV